MHLRFCIQRLTSLEVKREPTRWHQWHRGNFIAIGQQIQPLSGGTENAFAWCPDRGVRNAVFQNALNHMW